MSSESPFKFVTDLRFTAPVDVILPGEAVARRFSGTFRVVPEDALFPGDTAPETARDVIAEDRRRLADVWVGWTGILDEDGAPILFSEATRDQLLDYRHIRLAVSRAYFDALTETRAGN